MKKILVLGPGCPNCEALYKLSMEAVAETGQEAEVEKITDFAEIARMGVLSTPGLAVDDEVKASGRVPSKDEIKGWLA